MEPLHYVATTLCTMWGMLILCRLVLCSGFEFDIIILYMLT